jgi:hypothetical protein
MSRILYHNHILNKTIPAFLDQNSIEVSETPVGKIFYVKTRYDFELFPKYFLNKEEVYRYGGEVIPISDIYPANTQKEILYYNEVHPNKISHKDHKYKELDRYEKTIQMLTNSSHHMSHIHDDDVSKKSFYNLAELISYELLFIYCNQPERIFMQTISVMGLTVQPTTVLATQILKMVRLIFNHYAEHTEYDVYKLFNVKRLSEFDYISFPILISIPLLDQNLRFLEQTLFSWGDVSSGGDSSLIVQADYINGLKQVTSNNTAFGFVNYVGKVVCWGNNSNGGDCHEGVEGVVGVEYVAPVEAVIEVLEVEYAAPVEYAAAIEPSEEVLAVDEVLAVEYVAPVEAVVEVLAVEYVAPVEYAAATESSEEVLAVDEVLAVSYVAPVEAVVEVLAVEYVAPVEYAAAIESSEEVLAVDEVLAVSYVAPVEAVVEVLAVEEVIEIITTLSPVLATIKSDVSELFNNGTSFAAIKNDSSVVCWGDITAGGSVISPVDVESDLLSGVLGIVSTNSSYAALKEDGITPGEYKVITWGNASTGGDSSVLSPVGANLTSGVVKVFGNYKAFAAIKSDGSVVCWGDITAGGSVISPVDASSVLLSGVTDITYTQEAFVAIKGVCCDKNAVSWGNAAFGGDSTTLSPVTGDITQGIDYVYGNKSAFIAHKMNGSVVCWGNASSGGSVISPIDASASLTSDVFMVIKPELTHETFVVIKNTLDHSAICWGNASKGGDASILSPASANITNDVNFIYNNGNAICAIKNDGSVVCWGDASAGGSLSSPEDVFSEVNGDTSVIDINYTSRSFIAFKSDFTCTCWGDQIQVGNCEDVSNIQYIYCNEVAGTTLTY